MGEDRIVELSAEHYLYLSCKIVNIGDKNEGIKQIVIPYYLSNLV